MHRLAWSSRRSPVLLALAVVVSAVVAVGAAAWTASPSPSALEAHVADRVRGTGGEPVLLTKIPRVVQQAVVATEDERFYHHHGIDILGVIRALPYDVTHLSFAQGASTITEQVAKVLYLDGNDHSPWRKLEDAALAVKLENQYSKGQILAAYLNSAYFGEDAYGIYAASERYFGIVPARLNAPQASLLAGLIQAPSAYDPFRHPLLARARQEDVLRSLVRNHDLNQTAASSILDHALRLRTGASLPPVPGVDLAAGPAFIWWELALGSAVAVLGAAAIIGSRRSGSGPARVLVTRFVCFVAVLLGAAVIVRSFRTA